MHVLQGRPKSFNLPNHITIDAGRTQIAPRQGRAKSFNLPTHITIDAGRTQIAPSQAEQDYWSAIKHAALPHLDERTSFFGVYDGHGGKAVSKFCAKHLHTQVLRNEVYSSGDLAASVQKAFFRMDEMMKGQRGWRELAELGDKGQKFAGMLDGIIWSPKSGDSDKLGDGWDTEEEIVSCSGNVHSCCLPPDQHFDDGLSCLANIVSILVPIILLITRVFLCSRLSILKDDMLFSVLLQLLDAPLISLKLAEIAWKRNGLLD